MRPSIPLLLLLLAHAASAQSGEVRGRVVSAETGDPIPGANVVLAGTQAGAAADLDGFFRLPTRLQGEHVLVVSAVGFETKIVRTTVGARLLEVALKETLLGLGEAVVEREDAREWRRRLALFKRLFVGQSRLAGQSELINPEVLDLTWSASGELVAEAEAPLRLENQGLGYTITFHDLSFRGTADRRRWEGAITFEPLSASARQMRRWSRARRNAFLGSWPHFLRSWAQGSLTEDGFIVHRVSRPGDMPLIGAPLTDEELTAPLVAADSTGSETLRLGLGGAWMVLYTLEEDDSFFRRRGSGNGQRSWVTMEPDGVDVTRGGQVLQPLRVVRYGYWDWERVGELLPLDYEPDADS